MSEELFLVVDDDVCVRTGIASALERPGRRIITCPDQESAEIVLDTLPIHTAITDLRLSGPFGTEGLDLISYAIGRQPGMRVVLISGSASHELLREAIARGAMAVLCKPFGIDEIESLLGCAPIEPA